MINSGHSRSPISTSLFLQSHTLYISVAPRILQTHTHTFSHSLSPPLPPAFPLPLSLSHTLSRSLFPNSDILIFFRVPDEPVHEIINRYKFPCNYTEAIIFSYDFYPITPSLKKCSFSTLLTQLNREH